MNIEDLKPLLKQKGICLRKRIATFALALVLFIPAANGVVAHATSLDNIYANGYNAIMKVQNMYNQHGCNPYFQFEDGVRASSIMSHNHAFQELINNARSSISQFPVQLQSQKNTFSSILDKYQEPIYRIVISTIGFLNDNINYTSSSKTWGDLLKSFCEVQSNIGVIRNLCMYIPLEYKRPYSQATDSYQQRLLNMINNYVNQACDGNNNEAIPYIKQMLNYLGNQEYFSQDIKNYIINLSYKVNAYSKNINTNYLSNEELTNRFNNKFNTTNWNITSGELRQFDNMWNSIINETVSNYRVNRNIFSNYMDFTMNTKDPMNINKVWWSNEDNTWVGVDNYDSIIAKFTVPYSSDMITIAQTANYYVDGRLWWNLYERIIYPYDDNPRYFRFKLIRNGDKIDVYAICLNKEKSNNYNPQTGLGVYN